jgi:hypothetical protein
MATRSLGLRTANRAAGSGPRWTLCQEIREANSRPAFQHECLTLGASRGPRERYPEMRAETHGRKIFVFHHAPTLRVNLFLTVF